jgi:hypothetical protein
MTLGRSSIASVQPSPLRLPHLGPVVAAACAHKTHLASTMSSSLAKSLALVVPITSQLFDDLSISIWAF